VALTDLTTEHPLGFAKDKTRLLVSKPSVCGWGMNSQCCADQVFNGLSVQETISNHPSMPALWPDTAVQAKAVA